MQLASCLLSLLAISVVSASSQGDSNHIVASAWYAGWHAQDFPLSQVGWSKYTQLTYAFATTTPDPHVLGLEQSDLQLLPAFVTTAHQNGVKASLSIGGWTGSLYYSSNVGTPENRTAFVKAVIDIAQKYQLDGIDFDWEYPGAQGTGCNVVNPADTANFLSFLGELRKQEVGKKLILSAATAITPFADAHGNPSADVSGFSNVLDYIAIMNYDLWGGSAQTVGPNAPLNDSCADSAYQSGSATSAVTAWNKAGIPLNKIVLGVPSYGHSFRVSPKDAFADASHKTLALYPAFDAKNQPAGDSWDDGAGTDVCGQNQPAGGLWDFWSLVQAGYLTPNGDAANGIPHRFDTCSQTPFIYDEKSNVMISYDDAQSFAAKGKFIKSNGLRGFAMWEAGGDLNNTLLDSIRAAMTA